VLQQFPLRPLHQGLEGAPLHSPFPLGLGPSSPSRLPSCFGHPAVSFRHVPISFSQAIVRSWHALIFSWNSLTLASRRSIICSIACFIFIVWRCSYLLQCSVQEFSAFDRASQSHFVRQIVTYLRACVTYRRVLDWLPDLLHIYTTYYYTLQPTIWHIISFLLHHLQLLSPGTQSQSQIYVTTNGQSVRLSCNKAPIWGLWQDIYYCLTVTVSDERTGLSFARVTVSSRDSESYITTDGQSASLSWCQASIWVESVIKPIWGLRPDSYYS
jgi:hypothetical protein